MTLPTFTWMPSDLSAMSMAVARVDLPMVRERCRPAGLDRSCVMPW